MRLWIAHSLRWRKGIGKGIEPLIETVATTPVLPRLVSRKKI